MGVTSEGWSLRRASSHDVERLHALMGVPEVYRYLTDGVALTRWRIEQWIELAHGPDAGEGLGVWLLETQAARLAGGVELKLQDQTDSAELTYLLHPHYWGQGLATRMSWTVMQRAFASGRVTQVVAGADEPNTASVSVMRRLGMTFLRPVQYPLGPGVEYVYRRGDPVPAPEPTVIRCDG